jgi:hypothetical protein
MTSANENYVQLRGLCAFLSAFFAVKNTMVKNLKNHEIILIIEVGSPNTNHATYQVRN